MRHTISQRMAPTVAAALAVWLLASAPFVSAVAGTREDFAVAEAAFERGDYAAALRLIRPLAEGGDAESQDALSTMYYNGFAVPQDYVQAYKWNILAISRYPVSQALKRDLSIKNRDLLAAKMTPGQIAEAQKLARAWKSK